MVIRLARPYIIKKLQLYYVHILYRDFLDLLLGVSLLEDLYFFVAIATSVVLWVKKVSAGRSLSRYAGQKQVHALQTSHDTSLLVQ